NYGDNRAKNARLRGSIRCPVSVNPAIFEISGFASVSQFFYRCPSIFIHDDQPRNNSRVEGEGKDAFTTFEFSVCPHEGEGKKEED
ncbi:hypothetical protein X777_12889, partial [Ooceraea biroi]